MNASNQISLSRFTLSRRTYTTTLRNPLPILNFSLAFFFLQYDLILTGKQLK